MTEFVLSDVSFLMRCPACYGELVWATHYINCMTCGRLFLIEDGIPIFSLDMNAGHDEIDHAVSQHKRRQTAYSDHASAEEFEISRPHGAPQLYRWLLAEKFGRSVSTLMPNLRDALVLTVCGGSGMDSEFLARAGAKVIASDISIGAARRAHERARRYGLRMASIVADVEHLPFADHSVEVVYVHDGLHHLEDPLIGLKEMGRVAGRAISITEPSQAVITELAVRLGWALRYEDAGNRVGRLKLTKVTESLESLGFGIAYAGRYAMYYRHYPGRVARALSGKWLFPVAKAAILIINRFAARMGNKLTVQAVRYSDG